MPILRGYFWRGFFNLKKIWIMKTNASEETIVHYLNTLKQLHYLLNYTKRISMKEFSENSKISKNISTVLSNGRIIKNMKKGRHSEWEWIGIEPTREMAIKTIQELGKLNPPRAKVLVDGRKTKTKIELTQTKTVTKRSYLWGMFSFETTTTKK